MWTLGAGWTKTNGQMVTFELEHGRGRPDEAFMVLPGRVAIWILGPDLWMRQAYVPPGRTVTLGVHPQAAVAAMIHAQSTEAVRLELYELDQSPSPGADPAELVELGLELRATEEAHWAAEEPSVNGRATGLTSVGTSGSWLVLGSHRLAPGPVALTELADEPLIAPPMSVSCGRCVVLACRASGFEPDIRHQIDDYTTTLRLVEAGFGVALIPDLGLVDLQRDVEIVELTEDVHRQVLAIHRASSAGRPSLEAVLAASREVFTSLDLSAPRPAEPAIA